MLPTDSVVSQLIDGLVTDLGRLMPEAVLIGTIVLTLLMRMGGRFARVHAVDIGIVGALIAGSYVVADWNSREIHFAFSQLLVIDPFGRFVRLLLCVFLVLGLWLCRTTGLPDREDSADFTVMLLGAVLGMMLMASSNHLLMAFIAVEMASLPSYALAGFLKGRRTGSEASLKYVIYGAAASGVMLYGISLLASQFGTCSIAEIARAIVWARTELPMPAVVGMLLILCGLGFKISAVPFHFWIPDVFEGASAEIGAFLSTASKAAALALAARFVLCMTLVTVDARGHMAVMLVGLGWSIAAALTVTFGNLSALPQTNIKRMLAFSTVSHAGIMMAALSPMNNSAAVPLLFYLAAYLFMNLGIFAVVAVVRNATGSEQIADWKGLAYRSPVAAASAAIFLMSLLGLPPLIGFAAKFQVFATLFEVGHGYSAADPFFAWVFYGLLTVIAINTAVSAVYYLRIVRMMFLETPDDPAPIRVSVSARLLLSFLAAVTVAGGILWDPIRRETERGSVVFPYASALRGNAER